MFFCNCDKRNYIQKMWRSVRQIVQDKNIKNNKNVAYISVSQLSENLIRQGVKSTMFYRVPNPVGFPSGDQIKNINKSHTYLYVGRISEEKGVDLFCKAIMSVKEIYPNIEAVVVGDGTVLAKLKECYTQIHFVGWKQTDDVLSYMLNARTLVIPSRWHEIGPLTLLEAMSIGLPCIVSDCTSVSEFIKDNTNGFTFKNNDLDDLINKITTCEEIDMESLSKQAKVCFEKNAYNIDMHINKLIEVYNMELTRSRL